MAGAKGRTIEFRPLQTRGINSQVWQPDGSANDAQGCVFTTRGEVAKFYGIRKLVNTSAGTFSTNRITALGQFHWFGRTDILVNYAGTVAVVTGNTLTNLATNRFAATRPRDAHRFVQANKIVLILNGRDANLKWDGRKVTPLGVRVVPPAPNEPDIQANQGSNNQFTNLSIDGPAAGAEVTYQYRLTFVNDQGQESEPGASSPGKDDDDVADTDRYNLFLSGLGVAAGDVGDQVDIVARNVYRSTDGGNTYSFITQLPGLDSDDLFDWHKPGEEATATLAADGTNSPPPVARWAFPFRGRVYYGGNPDAPSVLFYSRLNGTEAVSTANLLDVSSHDGDVLVGGVQAEDYALIFKRRSLWILTHDRNELPTLNPVLTGVGAVSDRAIVAFEGRTYFLSDHGVYVYDGSKARPLSLELDRWVQQLPPAYLEDAVATVDADGRRILLSVVASGSTNNEVWVIHVDTGAISRLTGFAVSSFLPYKHEILVGCRHTNAGAAETFIGQWASGGSLASDDFDGRFETNWIDLGDPHSEKTYYRLDLWYVQTGDITLTVDWYLGYDDRTAAGTATVNLADPAATIWNEGNWGTSRIWDGPRLRSVRIDLNSANSPVILFGFETSRGDTPFKLVGWRLHCSEHGTQSEGLDLVQS